MATEDKRQKVNERRPSERADQHHGERERPRTAGSREVENRDSTSVETEPSAEPSFTPPDNFDNAGRDPQQIMDDNISQYVTGRPN